MHTHTHRWHNHPTMNHCFTVYLELFFFLLSIPECFFIQLDTATFSPISYSVLGLGRKHTTPSYGSTHTRTRNKYRLDHRNDNMTLFLNTRSEAIALNEHNLSNIFTHIHAHMHNDIHPTATEWNQRKSIFLQFVSTQRSFSLRTSAAIERIVPLMVRPRLCVCVCVYEIVRGMSLNNSKNPLNFKAERIIYTQYWLWVNIY